MNNENDLYLFGYSFNHENQVKSVIRSSESEKLPELNKICVFGIVFSKSKCFFGV